MPQKVHVNLQNSKFLTLFVNILNLLQDDKGSGLFFSVLAENLK